MSPARPATSGETGAANRTTVVVELFTSEGCSSCPPADQVLTWLDNRQPISNVEIIPLSEHVDYWNQQGWADPFSSPAFTERQREYADSLHSEAYTPQMVVDGKEQFVGSDTKRAVQSIAQESRAAKVMVRLEPINSAEAAKKNRAAFSVEVEKLPQLDWGKKGLVFFAVTENNLASSVLAGENSGRTLAYSAVVRQLKLVGKLEARQDATFRAQPTIEIAKNWKVKDLRAIVFVQVQDSRQIVGAAQTRFLSPSGGA